MSNMWYNNYVLINVVFLKGDYMSKQKIFEIARKKESVEKDLEEFTKLKEEAFRVFDNAIWATLKDIQKSYDSGEWLELRRWHDNHEEHNGYFRFNNPRIIREAFLQLNNANINRKEFAEMLSGCRDDIETYINELTDKLQNLEEQIDKAYNDFVQNETGEYKWIFEQSFVKELVLKFLLSESEKE